MSTNGMRIYVSNETIDRLLQISRETDRATVTLAEDAVAEAALSYFKDRKDDPARNKP
jgi:predicted transcriptional regulator